MEDYKTISKLNQSLLKKILISPRSFLEAQKKYQEQDESSEEHFVFGSMVDLMLTGTKAEFDEKYHRVSDDAKCTEAVKVIVEGAFKEAVELDPLFTGEISDYRLSVLQHCKYQNYQSNWKDDTRVDKIIEQGAKYFKVLAKSIGKTVISDTEYSNALACKMALQADQFIKPFVDKKYDQEVEFWDKFIVEFTFQGLDIKGELDRVVINHKTKVITPVDFKTTGKTVTGFQYDFWKYRYDFQAATYRIGLEQHPKIEELIAKGYSLNLFHYIVVEKDLKNFPMIFVVSVDVQEVGLIGGELSNGTRLEGLSQAIVRYKYASENNAWDYPMEYYQTGGVIMLET
jgi:hypothetical protein